MATKKKPLAAKNNPDADVVKSAPKKVEEKPTPKKNDLTRPAKFSLESWIDGSAQDVDTVRVTQNPRIAQKLHKLENEKQEVQSVEQSLERTKETPRRLAQKDARKQRIREIEAEIKALLPQLDGTWAEVQIRALSPKEEDKLRERKVKPGFEMVCHVFEITAVIREEGDDEDAWTELSVDEWAELFEIIGINQFQTLDRAAGNLTYSQAVTPDFFERFSQYRATDESA